MSMETTINIFTLNFWGIPFVSKNRIERQTALAAHLILEKYDIVCLQELWSKDDYVYIKEKLSSTLPYCQYFYSGVIGSGVCIFSKFVIEDVFFHQWSLNGYAHKVHHGDWFGGKGVGLCRVKSAGIKINIYSTHLHAEYNRTNDEYKAHRILQSFDMSQFIKLTSQGADVVILGGDLNIEPEDLSYKIICYNAQLQDSFFQAKERVCDTVGTNESIRNSYADLELIKKSTEGKRIDYIMYRSNPHFKVECLKYQFPLPERVPEQNFSYSDHEAIHVSLKIIKSPKDPEDITQGSMQYIEAMKESIAVCDAALTKMNYDKKCYWVYSALLFLVLLCTFGPGYEFNFKICNLVIQILITSVLCFTVFMAFIWNRMEVNAILTGKLGLEVIHANLLKTE